MTASGIYLDYNATTPCDPRVVERMLPFFTEIYGNPANGLHRQGRLAAQAVDQAREQVANFIGVHSEEIYFTSGATESNNLAIFGLARAQAKNGRKRIVTCAVEHKSVLGPCKKLEEAGFDLVVLPVDGDGQVLLEAAREAITEDTLLVSIQLANNEVGTIQPIRELSEIAHSVEAIIHCDAAQAIGKIPVDLPKMGIDMCSFSAHKLYGPKGVGGLYVSRAIRFYNLEPIIYGGGQENGIRPGTMNVPAIVGIGEACGLADSVLADELTRLQLYREKLENDFSATIPNIIINGKNQNRLPNTSSITFPGIDADALILNLKSVMVGTGSACSSGAIEPSHVLQAIGLARELAYSTIRVSIGRFTQEQELPLIVEEFVNAWKRTKA